MRCRPSAVFSITMDLPVRSATSQWSGAMVPVMESSAPTIRMVRRMDAASSTDALKPKRNPVSSRAVTAGRDGSSGSGESYLA